MDDAPKSELAEAYEHAQGLFAVLIGLCAYVALAVFDRRPTVFLFFAFYLLHLAEHVARVNSRPQEKKRGGTASAYPWPILFEDDYERSYRMLVGTAALLPVPVALTSMAFAPRSSWGPSHLPPWDAISMNAYVFAALGIGLSVILIRRFMFARSVA